MSANNLIHLVPKYKVGSNYSLYKKELQLWDISTNVADEKKPPHIVLYSLPEKDESRIREKVLCDVPMDTLKQADGLKELIKYLDIHLAKDSLSEAWMHYRDYEDYKRSDETILQYVNNFDHKYKQVENSGALTIPPFLLACKLIHNANLSEDETMIIMTDVDITKKDSMYEDAKKSLLKYKGGLMNTGSGDASSGYSVDRAVSVKQEAMIASDEQRYEEAYIAGYYRGNRGIRGWAGRGRTRNRGYMQSDRGGYGYSDRGNYSKGGYNDWRGHDSGRGSSNAGNWRGHDSGRGSSNAGNWRDKPDMQRQRPINPPGYDGEPTTCKTCGSYRHATKDCKSSSQNINFLSTDGQPLKCRSCGSFQHFMKDCTESWEYINASTKKVNLCDHASGTSYDDLYNYGNSAGDKSTRFEGLF